ncbi:hypothetical protein AB0M46_36045 [Dactylosporangium sp. NPDC051485]|uniref:hypothetical protein n=1 Tax=Dactylosporangium sp. NPDC051485 TaxID=3154846 RepID=UPI00341BEF13
MDQDLHTLLSSVRDDAPPPRLSVDDITAAGRHLARRRRVALLSSISGGTAATIAAVAAAVVLVAGPSAPLTAAGDRNPLASPSAIPVATAFADTAPFVTNYRGYTAGDYLVSDPDLVTQAYQQSSIDIGFSVPDGAEPSATAPGAGAGDAPSSPSRAADLLRGGILVVYRPGAFDPRDFEKSGEKVLVHSAVGLLSYAGGPTEPTVSQSDLLKLQKVQPAVPTLAWQYTDDAWAAIYWSSWETVPDRDTLLAIAEGLAPAAVRQFPVGFVPGPLPRGYQLLSVSYGTDVSPGSRVRSAVRLTPKPPALPLFAPYDFNNLPVLTLSMGRPDPNPTKPGHLDCPDSSSCTRVADDGSTYVKADLSGVKPASNVQISQITLAMKPENPDILSAWPSALKTFP